jgi:NAD(P)-dependent dehydrogenase (short-subunit alcohol dehydrogenase family)
VAAFAERDATVLGLHLPDAVKEAQNLDQRVAPAEADVTDTADVRAAGAEIGAVAVHYVYW